jgi:hypothetical protein
MPTTARARIDSRIDEKDVKILLRALPAEAGKALAEVL